MVIMPHLSYALEGGVNFTRWVQMMVKLKGKAESMKCVYENVGMDLYTFRGHLRIVVYLKFK